jgi:hypothetical protein
MNFNEKDMTLIKKKIAQAQAEINECTGLDVKLFPRITSGNVEVSLKQMFENMCSCWGVDLVWVSNRSRANDLPIMRKLLWMAGREKFPVASYTTLGFQTCTRNHVTVLRGIQEGKNWLTVRDEKFMKYYKQVKHYFDEPVDE